MPKNTKVQTYSCWHLHRNRITRFCAVSHFCVYLKAVHWRIELAVMLTLYIIEYVLLHLQNPTLSKE